MAEDPGNCVKIEFNTIELPPSVEIRESSIFSGEAGKEFVIVNIQL